MENQMQSTDEMAAELSIALGEFFKDRDSNPRTALEAMALTTASLVHFFRKNMDVDLAEEQIELLRKRIVEMAAL